MDRERSDDGLKIAVTAESRAALRHVLKTIARRTITSRAAVTEASLAIYGNPRTLRRFAERVRDGTLGPFHSWVYFIRRKTDGAIKIGRSCSPTLRKSDLQVGCPEELEVVTFVDGDVLLERLLLELFAPDRIRGEWFRPSAELTEFVRIVKRNRRPKYPDG